MVYYIIKKHRLTLTLIGVYYNILCMVVNINSNKVNKIRGDPSVDNIVVTIYLDGVELELDKINNDFDNMKYNPEKYPAIIYNISDDLNIDSSTTANLFNSGKIVIVGGKTDREINITINKLIELLEDKLNTNLEYTTKVNNIIVTSTYKTKFNLTALTIHLGLEETEYEPEQFPAIIRHLTVGDSSGVALIFNSGKITYVGANSINEVLDLKENLEKSLDEFNQVTN